MLLFCANLLVFLCLAPVADGAPSAVRRQELASMVAEVAPVVEAVAGRRFGTYPDVVLANEAILARVVLRERAHMLSTVEGLSEEEAAAKAGEMAGQQLALGFEGKYGFVDDRLYVSVERVIDTLLRNRAPARLLRPVLRVIIAHELTHALQDQHTRMDDLLRRARTDDAVMAMNCTFEGHAVWVHEQVAERLGLEEAAALMRGLMGYEVSLDTPMGPELFYSRYVYGTGRSFVAHHAADGGTEAVWAVLEAPPRTTGEIVHPERYPRPTPAPSGGLTQGLSRAVRKVGRREWTVRSATLGDYDLREQLLRAGGKTDLADGLVAGWSMTALGGEDDGTQVQVLRFTTPESADAYVQQMARRAAVQAETARGLSFLDVQVTDIPWVDGDRAVEASVAFRLDQGLEDRQAQRWVVRGSDVVQLLVVNHEPGRRRAAAAFRSVFRALSAR